MDFNETQWKSWKETENDISLRWNMVNDLTENYILKGRSKEEIKDFLGEPLKEGSDRLEYYLGMAGYGIDIGMLYLYFENEKVLRVEIWHG